MSRLLSLEGVSVTRSLPGGEKVRALEALSWTWHSGQTWALRGPNGSGKSTLLRLVRGELWPDHDGGVRTYLFDGTPRLSPLSVRERIAYISPESQDWYLSSGWALSVRQVLETGCFNELLPHRALSAEQHARLLEVAEGLQVQDWLERDIRSLSNGQRRRVLLARALVGRPLALLLDEFFEGIDTASSEGLREQMAARSREIPTLYTGHRDEGALEFATHELWLEGGKAGREFARGHTPVRQEERVNGRGGKDVSQPLVAPLAARAPAPLVELRHCTVVRGGKRVLEQVSWTVQPSENWVLVGHNGAGKSTLARLIRRELYPLEGGTVLHGGKQGGSNWDLWRRFPLVSSEMTPLHRLSAAGLSASARTLVASGFEAWTGYAPTLSSEQEDRVAHWMRYFGISHLSGRPANTLSAGEIKRCLLARAVVSGPDLLILDEPFDYLDKASKHTLMDLLCGLENTRFLLIAHRLEDIPVSATHLLRLERGSVVQAGPLERVAR